MLALCGSLGTFKVSRLQLINRILTVEQMPDHGTNGFGNQSMQFQQNNICRDFYCNTVKIHTCAAVCVISRSTLNDKGHG